MNTPHTPECNEANDASTREVCICEAQAFSLTPSDVAILKRCDPSVRGRVFIELQIVKALEQAAKDAGCRLSVEGDGESASFVSDVFAQDEVQVFVKGPGIKGWVSIILGNDGYDCISDYTMDLEDFLRPVNDLADFWGS